MKLDSKDKQILSILDWDARMPITKIAKQIKLNKDVVRYRIKNLEKEKVIKGYYTLINTTKLGFLSVRTYFDLTDYNQKIIKEMNKDLDKIFNAGYIFSIEGKYQLGIMSWEKSMYQFHNKLKKFRNKYGKHILKEEHSIFTIMHHFPLKILSKEKKETKTLKEEEIVIIDKNEEEILKELSKNSRSTTTELAKKLNIPQRTIAYKIKELEKKNIILGFRAIIDTHQLQLDNYYLEIFTHNNKQVNQIKTFAEQHENCTYASEIFQGADIELETEFENKHELRLFIEKLKELFPEIKKITTQSTTEYFKISYFPE